jgi:hypothetical protein
METREHKREALERIERYRVALAAIRDQLADPDVDLDAWVGLEQGLAALWRAETMGAPTLAPAVELVLELVHWGVLAEPAVVWWLALHLAMPCGVCVDLGRVRIGEPILLETLHLQGVAPDHVVLRAAIRLGWLPPTAIPAQPALACFAEA